MSILAIFLFAFRISWVGVLVLIGCAFVVWFVFRVVIDTITWFREEVFDDPWAGKPKQSKPTRPPKDPEQDDT